MAHFNNDDRELGVHELPEYWRTQVLKLRDENCSLRHRNKRLRDTMDAAVAMLNSEQVERLPAPAPNPKGREREPRTRVRTRTWKHPDAAPKRPNT